MRERYGLLGDYLTAQPGDTVTLSLSEVETIIGEPLPPMAGTRVWWMGRRTSRQSRAWGAAGWRVVSVAFRVAAPTVTFKRARSDGIE